MIIGTYFTVLQTCTDAFALVGILVYKLKMLTIILKYYFVV